MTVIFNILFPVLSIIVMGFFIGRAGIFEIDFFAGINRLVYRYGLAPLLFVKTASMKINFSEAIKYSGSLILLISCLIIISMVVALVLKMPAKMRGAFMHCSIRGNFAYVGLPIILYSFTGSGIEDKAMALAVVIITPAILFQNVSSIIIMIYHGKDREDRGVLSIALSIFKDPLIMGCTLGFTLNILGTPIPYAVIRTGESLGNMALPLALIGIGATIDLKLLRGALAPPIIAAFIKTFLSPVLMYIILYFFDIPVKSTAGSILMLISATSTAVSSYIVTLNYDGDGNLAGSTIIISSFASLLSLSSVLFIIH